MSADCINLISSIAPLLGGIITATVASDGYGDPTTSFRGDGGPATLAGIANPHGVALDALGNIYIVDLGNHCIRVVWYHHDCGWYWNF
jgi:NHL repeat